MEMIHEGIRYKCSECGKQFTTQSSLKQHFQTVHEGIKNHECNQCDFKASRTENLRYHIQDQVMMQILTPRRHQFHIRA